MKGERATIFRDKVTMEGDWDFEGETTAMWKQMTNYIRKATKEMFGVLKGKRTL